MTTKTVLIASVLTAILIGSGLTVTQVQAEDLPTREELTLKKIERDRLVEKNLERFEEIILRQIEIQQEIKSLQSQGVSLDSTTVNTLVAEHDALKAEIKALEDQTRRDIDPAILEKIELGKKLMNESGLDFYGLYTDKDYVELVIRTEDGSPEFEVGVQKALGDIPYRIQVGPNTVMLN